MYWSKFCIFMLVAFCSFCAIGFSFVAFGQGAPSTTLNKSTGSIIGGFSSKTHVMQRGTATWFFHKPRDMFIWTEAALKRGIGSKKSREVMIFLIKDDNDLTILESERNAVFELEKAYRTAVNNDDLDAMDDISPQLDAAKDALAAARLKLLEAGQQPGRLCIYPVRTFFSDSSI